MITREEILAAFDKIADRYMGADWAPAKPEVAKAAAAMMRKQAKPSGLCRTCEANVNADVFEPKTTNAPLDAHLQVRNQKKMRAEDQGQGWEAVDAAVRARQEARKETGLMTNAAIRESAL
jgi:hypothetical protein